MAETAATKNNFHPYTTKVTLPAEEIDLASLLWRLEDVEGSLAEFSKLEESAVFDPSALDLPCRELRRIRKGLAAVLGLAEDHED